MSTKAVNKVLTLAKMITCVRLRELHGWTSSNRQSFPSSKTTIIGRPKTLSRGIRFCSRSNMRVSSGSLLHLGKTSARRTPAFLKTWKLRKFPKRISIWLQEIQLRKKFKLTDWEPEVSLRELKLQAIKELHYSLALQSKITLSPRRWWLFPQLMPKRKSL